MGMCKKILVAALIVISLLSLNACSLGEESIDQNENYAVMGMASLLDILLFPETITVYEVLSEHTAEDGKEWLRVYIDYSAQTQGGGRNRSIQKYAINVATGEMFNHNYLYEVTIRASDSNENADDWIRRDYEEAKRGDIAKKLNADKILKAAQDILN